MEPTFRWVRRVLVATSVLLAGVSQASGVSGQGTWEATLLGRDINGESVPASSANAVFLYDTSLNITWLRNGNMNGPMDWAAANGWASSLVVGTYGGWKLPTLGPVNGVAFQYSWSNNGTTDIGYPSANGWGTSNELGHLFYVTLGNSAYCAPNDLAPSQCSAQSVFGLTNSGSFLNLQAGGAYWTGAQYSNFGYWGFYTGFGYQDAGTTVYGPTVAIAVRSGDVLTAVPEPQTYALLLGGLVLLGALRARMQRK